MTAMDPSQIGPLKKVGQDQSVDPSQIGPLKRAPQMHVDPKTIGPLKNVTPQGETETQSGAVNPRSVSGLRRVGGTSSSSSSTGSTQLADPSTPTGGHSWLNQIAGHQDLLSILNNAANRDIQTRRGRSSNVGDFLASDNQIDAVERGMKDPNSAVYKAWQLYKHDPAAAMDEYGMGSPAQNKFMRGADPQGTYGHVADWELHHPRMTGIGTFFGELMNPIANVEGLAAGKALGLLTRTPLGMVIGKALSTAADKAGFSTPMRAIVQRGGKAAGQWMQGIIYTMRGESGTARKKMLELFGGLHPEEQNEVVRVSQGLKPKITDPTKAKIIADRANKLRADIKDVTAKRLKRGLLKPEDEYNSNRYFPMSGSYDFGPQYELEQQLMGKSTGGRSTVRPKVYDNFDESLESGKLDKDFSAPTNYMNWRRQVMQHLRFDEGMERAPATMRQDLAHSHYEHVSGQPMARPYITRAGQTEAEATRQKVLESQQHYPPGHPERLQEAHTPDWVAAHRIMPEGKSPMLDKSVLAPELVKFFQGDSGFQRYVTSGGTSLPGEAQTPFGRFLGIFRNMILTNPWFHPAWNVGGNDAAARGVHGLGGAMYDIGGAGYNLGKALALQLGIKKPGQFIAGAKNYAQWLDRAMMNGGIAEFSAPRTTALGEDYAKTMSRAVPKLLSKEGMTGTAWYNRLDRSLTKMSDWNLDRTFGQRGEQAFAVSLFKDAVEKGGMADHEAAALVRETMGNYLDFDPKSPLNSVLFFMPWLKSNSKFWVDTLARKPQYLTAPQHAIRNYNQATGDPAMQGQYPAPDYRIYTGPNAEGQPGYVSLPLPQRIASDIMNMTLGEPGTQDVGSHLYAAMNVLRSRATPPVRVALDAIQTFSNKAADPNLDASAMYAPMAPRNVQYEQAATSILSRFLPIPLAGFVAQDVARRGWQRSDLENILYSAAGVGYGSSGLTDDDRRTLNKIRGRWERTYSRDMRANEGDPSGQQAQLQDDYANFLQDLKDNGFVK